MQCLRAMKRSCEMTVQKQELRCKIQCLGETKGSGCGSEVICPGAEDRLGLSDIGVRVEGKDAEDRDAETDWFIISLMRAQPCCCPM